MSYGFDKQLGSLQAEIRDCHELVQDLDLKVKEQQAEMSQLKLDLSELFDMFKRS